MVARINNDEKIIVNINNSIKSFNNNKYNCYFVAS